MLLRRTCRQDGIAGAGKARGDLVGGHSPAVLQWRGTSRAGTNEVKSSRPGLGRVSRAVWDSSEDLSGRAGRARERGRRWVVGR